MKKKLWCVLCIMICMMLIVACGQKENPEKKESENPSLIVMINDDGTLKVDYSDDDDYYTFHCVKSDSE